MKLSFIRSLFSKKSDLLESFSSRKYWEERYKKNGTSGPGSYGRLASWKAKMINKFVNENDIQSIIELGCGDGNQLKLGKYKEYTGLDVSDFAVRICRELFKTDGTKKFYNYNKIGSKHIKKADLVLSLDVIFHLIEDYVFEQYMRNMFELSSKYVIIYSSNYDGYITDHVKCRKFTDWVERNLKGQFEQIAFIPNIYPYDKNEPNDTSMSDFYIYERILK